MIPNIASLLDAAAIDAPGRVAYRDATHTLTYEQLHAMAGRAARQLALLDVEHVVVADDGTAAFVVALFGAASAGVPLTPVVTDDHPEDLRQLIDDLQPVLLIGDIHVRQHVSGIGGVVSVLNDEFLAGVATGPGELRDDGDQPIAVELPRRLPEGFGTVAVSHDALLRLAGLAAASGDVDRAGATVVARDTHDVRTIVALLAAIESRGTICLERRLGAELKTRLTDLEATHLEIASDRLPALVEATAPGALPDLGSLVVGDTPLPAALLLEASRTFGVDIEFGYGLVESGVVQIGGLTTELMADLAEMAPGERVVGRVRAGVELDLDLDLDADPDVDLGADLEPSAGSRALSAGLLRLRGPIATADRDGNGWHAMGFAVTRFADDLAITTDAEVNQVDGGTYVRSADTLRSHPEVRDAGIVAGPDGPQLVVVLEPHASVTDTELGDLIR